MKLSLRSVCLNCSGADCKAVKFSYSSALNFFPKNLGTLFAVGLIVSLLVSESLGQKPLTEKQWKLGYEGFNVISSGLGLEHKTNLGVLNSLPASETVLVVLGGLRLSPAFIEQHFQYGGAVLVASDATGISFSKLGVHFGYPSGHSGSFQFDQENRYREFSECPVIKGMTEHPILEDVESIVGNKVVCLNRTRFLSRRREVQRPNFIAFLPINISSNPCGFIGVSENDRGGRIILMADQSVFSNQMLLHGDNAMLALNSMKWLVEKPDGTIRKHLIVWDGKKFLTAVDTADVDVKLPPPTSAEVLEALKNLPAASLLEFGNSVVAAVEDEDIINEFIRDTMDKQSPKKIDRFWILVSFSLVCVFSLVTYMWQKKLLRNTSSDVAARRSANSNKKREGNAAFHRQMAVEVLLDTFCVEAANRRYYDCPAFPDELIGSGVYGDQKTINTVFNSMKKVNQLYHTKSKKYWTTQRLLDLESEVAKWKAIFPNCATKGTPSGAAIDIRTKNN
ncbi:MAG: hypothetical protein AB8B55_12925 [Mariniblastus sp.]